MKHLITFAVLVILATACAPAPALTPSSPVATTPLPTSTSTSIPPTATSLPTATETLVPPTATAAATMPSTATPIPFLVVNAKTGQEESLSADNQKLRGIIENHITELFRNTAFAGLAVNYGDASNIVFLYFSSGIGDTQPVYTKKIASGRYEIVFSGNMLNIWNNLLRNFTLIPNSDSTLKTIFNVKENLIEFEEIDGKIVETKALPKYETILPHCVQGGQEIYVYSPSVLEVHGLCVRLSGVVKSISNEGEGNGNFTFEVALDPPFTSYLNDENRKRWDGNLHVVIVCHKLAGASGSTCKEMPESMRVTPPQVGQHVWMEGQWVEDWNPSGWAELHPVFRWEPFK